MGRFTAKDSNGKNIVFKINNENLVMGITRVSWTTDSLSLRASSGVTYSGVTDYNDDVENLKWEKVWPYLYGHLLGKEDQLQGSIPKCFLTSEERDHEQCE